MSRWKAIEFDSTPETTKEWSELPREAGCYAFFLGGNLGYIGSSQNVAKRISSHEIRFGYSNAIITPWGRFKRVTVKVSKSKRFGDWAMRELRLIDRLRPRFNRLSKGRRR